MNRLACNSMLSFLAIVLLVVSSPVSHANENAMPSDLELLARDGITINSVNLTAKHFFKSYMSDLADERRSAELYLLGVFEKSPYDLHQHGVVEPTRQKAHQRVMANII